MRCTIVEIIVVAIFVPLVVSGCSSTITTAKNVKAVCKEWWGKASASLSSSETRANCLLMIQKKCPDMITISITTSKEFEDSHELWINNGVGALKEGQSQDLYFTFFEKKPVCFDDHGKVKDCDWWWVLAQDEDIKTKYRARCIDRIFRHCKHEIRITEERPCQAKGALSCKGGKVVTYSYVGETTSISN